MPTLLCFGDSNTWGFHPASITAPHPERHAPEVRWTGVAARELGAEWRIIEEGQNGRMTVHDDPFNVARNARVYLPACLESHKPLDVVVLMLGTNDLKAWLNLPPSEIAAGAGVLARLVLASDSGPGHRPPRLLLVSPPAIGDLTHLPDLAARLPNGKERSRALPRHYEALSRTLGCAYLNSQEWVTPSPLDGIHLDADAHATLGRAIAAAIRELA